MDALVSFANWFIGLFEAGAENLISLVSETLPLVAVMMTAITAIIKFIGEDRVNNFCEKIAKYPIMRYTILPLVSFFCFGNPICCTTARFLPEKYKISYEVSLFSIAHPLTGLFPHVNSAELFVWLGIAEGVQELGYDTTGLAIWYLLIGMVVGLVRGIVCQRIWEFYAKKRGLEYA